MQYFNATPVRPRVRPPAIPSRLPVGDVSPTATIYLQDVYNGLKPIVPRGAIAKIRVVREMQKTVRIDPSLRAFGFQFPVISCGATYAGKDVIGEVDVNPDGSACFEVPAGVPLYFMALDRQGQAVQRMRSFTHLMPGEVQGCIGCHEHRLESPHRDFANYLQPPQSLQPPEWGQGGFDYARIVQPVLDQHCIQCHNPREAPEGIDLSGDKTDYFNVSYDVLARENQGPAGSPYVSWIPTYNGQEKNILQIEPRAWGSPQSKLAEVVLGGHPDSTGKPRIQLTSIERRRILAWIDLNVPYYGSSETAHPTAPGCRRMYPADLDRVLADVAKRRCAECHTEGKIPRPSWTRITNPQWNQFLLAPLAKSAGGTQRCGQAVFRDVQDADYQAILATFLPIEQLLERTPRMDMPGAQASCDVNRSCQ
jgi:mono/diheme cytochrome c family protein